MNKSPIRPELCLLLSGVWLVWLLFVCVLSGLCAVSLCGVYCRRLEFYILALSGFPRPHPALLFWPQIYKYCCSVAYTSSSAMILPLPLCLFLLIAVTPGPVWSTAMQQHLPSPYHTHSFLPHPLSLEPERLLCFKGVIEASDQLFQHSPTDIYSERVFCLW